MRFILLIVALAFVGSVSLEGSTASAQTADLIRANKKAKKKRPRAPTPSEAMQQWELNRSLCRRRFC